jgi:hypothetical protein
MNNRQTVTLAATVFLSTFCFVASPRAQDTEGSQSGFVYTESNLLNNSVLVFNRAANGTLSLAATVPTGGAGGGVDDKRNPLPRRVARYFSPVALK